LEDKVGIFEYDPSLTAPDLIAVFINDLGFSASLEHVENDTEKSKENIHAGLLILKKNISRFISLKDLYPSSTDPC